MLQALDKNDPLWRTRELIVMPSHADPADIKDIRQMINLAHAAGFDVVAAPVVYWNDQGDNRAELALALALRWDVRWTIPNSHQGDPSGQLWSLGSDLWTWISRALMQ